MRRALFVALLPVLVSYPRSVSTNAVDTLTSQAIYYYSETYQFLKDNEDMDDKRAEQIAFSLTEAVLTYIEVDPLLALAIMKVESNFRPRDKSKKEAKGLMQILDSTARGVARRYDLQDKSPDLFDPHQNIIVGVAYLQYLDTRTKSNKEMLIEYNAGPKNLKRWKRTGRMPKETELYVKQVTKYHVSYQSKLLDFGKSMKQTRAKYHRATVATQKKVSK